MDYKACLLTINASIDIKRSNGRVHAANITAINLHTGTVTVEWFESDEMKGKEIDFEEVYTYNPDLKPKRHDIEVPRSTYVNRNKKAPNGNAIKARASRVSYVVQPKVRAAAPAVDQSKTSVRNSGALSPRSLIAVDGRRSSKQEINGGGLVKRSQKYQAESGMKPYGNDILKEEDFVDPSNPNCAFLSMIRDFRHELDFCPLTDGNPKENHQITVAIRKRPLNIKELVKNEMDVITIPQKDVIYVHEPKTKVDLTKYMETQKFRFDYTFNEFADNELVYKFTARPLVYSIFEGGMASCFAYGQTGSGKTHTMGGDFQGKIQDCTKGIYALASSDVFKILKSKKYRHLNLRASVSFFEIYGAKVFDLLNQKKKLKILEDGKQVVQVVGLQERICEGPDDVFSLIDLGSQNRTSGQTTANNLSSRSHAVLQIILRNLDHLEVQTRNCYRLHGKLSLIDLAGNERGADTKSDSRQARIEGAEINKSLLALKECIRALGRKGAHQPFRSSKLTLVLKDSFSKEKSKTCMIGMISPGVLSCEQSLNTLRYADRVKELGAQDLKNASPLEEENEASGFVNECSLDSEEGATDEEQMSQLAISSIQEAEEEVVEHHGQYFLTRDGTDKSLIALYEMTNTMDYDIDEYSQRILETIDKNIAYWESMNSKVIKLKSHIIEEENIHRSQSLKKQ